MGKYGQNKMKIGKYQIRIISEI